MSEQTTPAPEPLDTYELLKAQKEQMTTRTMADIAAEVIEGYKTGISGGPMRFVSGAFDCGWTLGARERSEALAVPQLRQLERDAE